MAWHLFGNGTSKCFRMLHSLSIRSGRHLAQATSNSAFHVSATNKMAEQLDVSGVFPPIPTPFNANEEIDYEMLRLNLNKWNKIPFAG